MDIVFSRLMCCTGTAIELSLVQQLKRSISFEKRQNVYAGFGKVER